jgi:DNA repair protein RadC
MRFLASACGLLDGAEGLPQPGVLADHATEQAPREAAMGDSQRLSDTEQLEILALLEAVSTERSAMRAARALAELMGHLHDLGQRIAAELPGQDRGIKPARR